MINVIKIVMKGKEKKKKRSRERNEIDELQLVELSSL